MLPFQVLYGCRLARGTLLLCHPVLGAHNRVLEVKLSDWPDPDSQQGEELMRRLNAGLCLLGRKYE
jgi:hypothetical protein